MTTIPDVMLRVSCNLRPWLWLIGMMGLACGTVSEPHPVRPVRLEIVLDRDTLDAIADTLPLHARVFDRLDHGQEADSVIWSSEFNGVARIAMDSFAIATGNGRTRLYAQRGALADTATLVIRQVAVALQSVWPAESLFVGDTITAVFGAVDRHRFAMPPPAPPVISSSSPQLVNEGAGRFRAAAPGLAQIQATSETLSGTALLLIEGPFISVGSGGSHTCALLARGAVYCWGFQLGGRPQLMASLPSLTFLTADDLHSCGLTAEGVAYCWGSGAYLQAGGLVQTSERFRSISVGYEHICGNTFDSRAVCWGWNQDGQIGSGPTGPGAFVTTPTSVPGIVVVLVSAGALRSCALTSQGIAYCWGLEFGDVPVQVGGATRFSTMDLGGGFVCGLTTVGAIACLTGQTPSHAPLPLRTMDQGNAFTCALADGGEAFCWGENTYGELGDGTFLDRADPVAAAPSYRFSVLSAGGSFALAGKHTCGVSGGIVYCWGANSFGQLGVQAGGSRCFQQYQCFSVPVRIGRPRAHP